MRLDLVGSSLGDSPKESRSSLGMRREIARKKTRGLAVRLSEVAGVCGTQVELNQLTKELVNVKVKPEFVKSRPGDMELNLKDKVDLKRAGLLGP
ncbi:hypothetical protein GW17_00016409 [Ensete ventricosum]|nr:hypothetical protein GW17_00016409 [Ensete ventricosum]